MNIKSLARLSIGLILYAIGIVLTINANLGLAPWDAFHMGLSQVTGISFGQISIIVGLAVLLINYQLEEAIGMGTILNIVAIGLMIDAIFAFELIPLSQSLLGGILMILSGMVLIAFASFCYIGAGFGTGPRDGLMVALTRVTTRPVGFIRGAIEISVLILGALLGAKIGLGTVILAFGFGPVVQTTFKLFHFEPETVHHSSFLQKSKLKKAME
jgi:uncharacterized membrane protein YczE